MIVYVNEPCFVCHNKQLVKQLRIFTYTHKLKYEIRNIAYSHTWKAEAERYSKDTPFAVEGEKSASLNNLEELL